MNDLFNDETLTRPAAAAKLADSDWVALHVPRFKRARPAYETYASFLSSTLRQACKRLSPTAIVEARTKEMASFAEKILRKRKLYQAPDDSLPPDPLVRMTDLCGARVVTQSANEVQAICKFIENAFDIDWQNTEDASQRLKPTEFGYRSVHYIVQVNQGKLSAAGVQTDVARELLGLPRESVGGEAGDRPLKAEIQVRTLLEHAAAALGHDTFYKTELKVPNRIRRQYATLAAMLESVDTGFGELLASLKEYESSFGAFHTRDTVLAEIARLQVVLQCEPQSTALRIRIARHALAIGRHELAAEALAPCAGENHFGVQRTLGQALVERHWDEPRTAEYVRGCKLLAAACAHPPRDSETLCLLAESVARDDDHRARELFHESIQADATEPVTLARYLEFEICHQGNDHAVRLAAPMIRAAMERCRKQIEARVNMPSAWSSLAFFHLILGESFEAFDALARLADLCQGSGRAVESDGSLCAAGRALRRFQATLRRIRCIRERLPAFDWCERAAPLMLAVRAGSPNAVEEVRALASWKANAPHFSPADVIVILAGGYLPDVEGAADEVRPHLLRACHGLSFKLLCSGTTTGVSALAGDVAEQSSGAIQTYGYVAESLPRGITEDDNEKRFSLRIGCAGAACSPLAALQAWTDLFAAGVDLSRVRLLSHEHGELAQAQCALALALGARVALIQLRTGSGSQPRPTAWHEHPGWIPLPMDAMTLRAFLLVENLPLTQEQQVRLEKAARRAHDDYTKTATPRDPSVKPWDQLDDSLKLSNFQQIAYWENVLQQHGLRIRPLTDHDLRRPLLNLVNVIGESGIKTLAEMEHGRWNMERLSRGWRWDPEKDVAGKLSPYLVSWLEVPPEIQGYDVDAIRGLPAKLREMGLEIETATPEPLQRQ